MKNDYEIKRNMLLTMLVTDPVNQLPNMPRRYLRCSDDYIKSLMEFEPCCLNAIKVKACSRHFEGYIIGYGHFGVPKDYVITESQAYQLLINDLADLEMRLHRILYGRLNLMSTTRWEALLDIMFAHGPQALLSSRLFRLVESNVTATPDLVRAFHAPEFTGQGLDRTIGRNERCMYRANLWFKNRDYDV